MANKKTQRDFFNEIMAVVSEAGRTDLADFVKGRIEALDKKSTNRKPTKTQKENVGLKSDILEVLREGGKKMTVTEILASGAFDATVSSQKVSALLKQMIELDRTVTKTVDKKVSYFSAVAENEGTEEEVEAE